MCPVVLEEDRVPLFEHAFECMRSSCNRWFADLSCSSSYCKLDTRRASSSSKSDAPRMHQGTRLFRIDLWIYLDLH